MTHRAAHELPVLLLSLMVSLNGCGEDEKATERVTVSEATKTPTASPAESPSSTPSESPAAPETTEVEDPYEDYRDDDGFISRDEYGKGWPLTVDAGFVSCPESFGDGAGAVIFTTLDGDEYALNGQATHDWPEIAPITANDRSYGKKSRIKMSVFPLIDMGLEEC